MVLTQPNTETWPQLPLSAWRETQETLHLWTQIVGKIKLELTPFLIHWWNVAFAVTPRGLTTGTMPAGVGAFAIDFDFVDHMLFIHVSDGRTRALPLIARSVADFYAELLFTLRAMGIEVTINPVSVEIPDPISCDVDTEHASYDPEPVQRWCRIMIQTERILQRYRSPFVGKSSPVNFFGRPSISVRRAFRGVRRRRPRERPASCNWPRVKRPFACGFWPGNASMSGVTVGEPAFYAYLYPAPPGLRDASVRPGAASYNGNLGEFLLRYEDARRAPSPDQTILDFFQSAYEAAATLAGWDRHALERATPD